MESDCTSEDSFPPTRWTLIAKVGEGAEPEIRARAISDLCEVWTPSIPAGPTPR